MFLMQSWEIVAPLTELPNRIVNSYPRIMLLFHLLRHARPYLWNSRSTWRHSDVWTDRAATLVRGNTDYNIANRRVSPIARGYDVR